MNIFKDKYIIYSLPICIKYYKRWMFMIQGIPAEAGEAEYYKYSLREC